MSKIIRTVNSGNIVKIFYDDGIEEQQIKMSNTNEVVLKFDHKNGGLLTYRKLANGREYFYDKNENILCILENDVLYVYDKRQKVKSYTADGEEKTYYKGGTEFLTYKYGNINLREFVEIIKEKGIDAKPKAQLASLYGYMPYSMKDKLEKLGGKYGI